MCAAHPERRNLCSSSSARLRARLTAISQSPRHFPARTPLAAFAALRQIAIAAHGPIRPGLLRVLSAPLGSAQATQEHALAREKRRADYSCALRQGSQQLSGYTGTVIAPK